LNNSLPDIIIIIILVFNPRDLYFPGELKIMIIVVVVVVVVAVVVVLANSRYFLLT